VAPLLIGLTVVAFATSAPEILVSIVASVQGEPTLAFGNAIGSNIVNIGLVLGVTALIRPIKLESATLRREMPALLAVSLLTVSLFLDQYLSRIDGLVMLTGLVIVMVWLARLGTTRSPATTRRKSRPTSRCQWPLSGWLSGSAHCWSAQTCWSTAPLASPSYSAFPKSSSALR
jgi:Ca2+/Na+ antiporter